MKKERLDLLLVEKGLVESRTRAQGVIRAGEVLVAEQVVDKPGILIDPALPLRVRSRNQDVSRGAGKLRTALDRFGFDLADRTAADLGASTGGFTQVLLERGVRWVAAFDVGYGLIAESLRTDPRVRLFERTNVRHLTGTEIEPVEVVTLDLSFIGLELIWPAVNRISNPSMNGVALVKPQFEVGKGQVPKGGVVRDKRLLRGVLEEHLEQLEAGGFRCWGCVPSAVKGKKGNQEFLSWFRRVEQGSPPALVTPEDILESIPKL